MMDRRAFVTCFFAVAFTVLSVSPVSAGFLCGGEGEVPCPSGGCHDGLHVQVAVCTAYCGGEWEVPCTYSGCLDGRQLLGPLCTYECGGEDEVICTTAGCLGGRSVGQNGKCYLSLGGDGEVAHPGYICDDWNIIDPSWPFYYCQACGYNGGAPCVPPHPDTCQEGLEFFIDAVCEPCGGSYGPACSPGPACDAYHNTVGDYLDPADLEDVLDFLDLIPDVCVPCGDGRSSNPFEWVPCQQGASCRPDHNNILGFCIPCGSGGEMGCFEGEPCDPGYRFYGDGVFGTGIGTCVHIGEIEEPETGSTFTAVPPQHVGEPLWGFADIHEHQFSNLAYGGTVLWGSPFDEKGVNTALAKCDFTRDFEVMTPDLPTSTAAIMEAVSVQGFLPDSLDAHIWPFFSWLDLSFSLLNWTDLNLAKHVFTNVESHMIDFIADVLDAVSNERAPHDIFGRGAPIHGDPYVTQWIFGTMGNIATNVLPDGFALAIDYIGQAAPTVGEILVNPAYLIAHAEILTPDFYEQNFPELANVGSPAREPGPQHWRSGVPSFDAWPHFLDGSHQQMYHRWLKRAYEGGLRLMVNLTVNNKVLCDMSFRRERHQFLDADYNCEDMATVDDQILAIKALEAFVDREDDGLENGTGWYRVAYSASHAREIVEDGAMAIIIGIEVDTLFGCGPGNAGCDEDYLDQKVAEYHAKGVRYVFPVHAFDNAFAGPSLYANFFVYGNMIANHDTIDFWDCSIDPFNYSYKLDPSDAPLDIMYHQFQDYYDLPTIPPYDGHCNKRGLTESGAALIRALVKHKMIIDIDHMSEITLHGLQGRRFTKLAAQYKFKLEEEAATDVEVEWDAITDEDIDGLTVTDEDLETFLEYAGLLGLEDDYPTGALDLAEDYGYPLVSSHASIGLSSCDSGGVPAGDVTITDAYWIDGDEALVVRGDQVPGGTAVTLRNANTAAALGCAVAGDDGTWMFELEKDELKKHGGVPCRVRVDADGLSGERAVDDPPPFEKGNEGNLSLEEMTRVRDLGGMMSVYPPRREEGTANHYFSKYKEVVNLMRGEGEGDAAAGDWPGKDSDYPRIALTADFGAFVDQAGPRFKRGAAQEYEVSDAIPWCGNTTPPLEYPFVSFDGAALFHEQQTGDRTFDFNVDGFAHVGLFPDLLADVRNILVDKQDDYLESDTPDSPFSTVGTFFDPIFGSAEAFVQLWAQVEDHVIPPPSIEPVLSGVEGDNGWYTSDVVVDWEIMSDFPVLSSSGCDPVIVDFDTTGFTLTCIAENAGGVNEASVTVRRDATPPNYTVQRVPDVEWTSLSVTVNFAGWDDTSGLAGPATVQVVVDEEGTGLTATHTFTDNAGLTTDAAMGGINIDRTPPAVTVSAPAQGARYVLREERSVQWSAEDDLSGVAFATATAPNGSSVKTDVVGIYDFEVQAVDRAGNSTFRVVTYEVMSAFDATVVLQETLAGCGLPRGIENSLLKLLEGVCNALDKGKSAQAAHRVEIFIHRMETMRDKKLTGEQADEISAYARLILRAIQE